MKNKKYTVKINFFLFLIFYLSFSLHGHISPLEAFAQTSTKKPSITSSPSPTEEKSKFDALNSQINDLKDRIASRVAQLRLVEKRGIIGTVTEASNTQISLTDIAGNKRFIDVDGITKFSSSSQKASFGISDITKGTKISVIGLYNKQSRRILARFVGVFTLPSIINGMVSAVNKSDSSLSVVSEDSKETTVDVETVTKTNTYTKDGDITRAGFSKIEVNNRIIVVGYPDRKNPERIVATRILLLSELPANPRIVVPGSSTTEDNTLSPTPTAVSGKKVTPAR